MDKKFQLVKVSLTDQKLSAPGSNRYAMQPVEIKEGLSFKINSNKIEETLFEVSFELVLEGNIEEHKVTAYQASAQYSGIFEIEGFSPEEFDKIIKTNCSTILYPYTRERVMNSMLMTSFPVNVPQIIDFFGMYESQLKNPPQTMEEAKEQAEDNNKED